MTIYKNEETDLGLHVSVCQERYNSLDERLTKVEAKLDNIEVKLDSFKHEIATMIIKGGFAIVLSMFGLLGATLKLLGQF
jgi:hypothetical protein